MCGLCGFLSYDNKPIPSVHTLTEELMEASAIRGTDACGVAFCHQRKLQVMKDGKSAYQASFKVPKSIKALIGHTRHTTQGSERKNYNNHPFLSKHFALAHNGVLGNDKELRKTEHLPCTKIETDSYVAVQLLEKYGGITRKSLKKTAELLQGSFSFSILEETGDLHFIKGDSPLSLLHFLDKKLYVYASTDEILWRALIETELFSELKKGVYEEIKIPCGTLLTIKRTGELEWNQFEYQDSYSSFFDWKNYGNYESFYLEDLKSVAASLGVRKEEIDMLIKEGFSYDEIEDFIYNDALEV